MPPSPTTLFSSLSWSACRRVATRALPLALPLSLVACAATPAPPVAAPAPSYAPAPATADTTAAPTADAPPAKIDASGALRQEDFSSLFTRPRAIDVPFPAAPAQTPAPAAVCQAFVDRSTTSRTACDESAAHANLATALADSDATTGDSKLAALEKCTSFPAGFVRALRAERAPAVCGDAIVAPYLASARTRNVVIAPQIQHALYGLGVAARLARSDGNMPTLAPPFTKDRVKAFINGPIAAWLETAAAGVQANAEWAAKLEGYGRGVAAIEAGVADFRLVDAIRSAPIPDEFSRDAELKATYESSLDDSLTPRLERGRDAALIGLRDLAQTGAFADARSTRARDLLSKLYAGRRIDALDALQMPVLPPFPVSAATTTDTMLAALLPTFYAGVLFTPDAMTDSAMLRALMEKGFPTGARANLKKKGFPRETRQLEAAGRLLLARRYWRAIDVEEAVAIAATWDPPQGDVEAMIGALAQALRGGPEDALHMMLQPSKDGLHLGDTAALNRLGAGSSSDAGAALFDAARIEQLSTPVTAGPGAWRALALKYRAAADKLVKPASDDAKARANEADSVANATKTTK